METIRKHQGLLILPVLCVSIILLFSCVRLRIQTDKPSYNINETITAQLFIINQMPFPLPTASYTKIEAQVQVNGVSDKTGWAAFITPASQFVLVGSGEHNIFMPVKYTPTEAGTVEFVFTIHSPVGTNTVRKTVKVFDPVNTSETVGT